MTETATTPEIAPGSPPDTSATETVSEPSEPSEATPEPDATHTCSNGHPCRCTDIPEGGHACGRTPELEEGPHAEELARLAAATPP